MTPNIDIATNNFRRGGGTESYMLDLVRGLHARGITPTVYAAKADTEMPEYRFARVRTIDQSRILKKLRPFFFAHQLKRARSSTAKLVALHHTDGADLLICGGTHLGYLQNSAQKAGILDRLTIRSNRRSYRSARLIMAHSHLMAEELVGLYGIPSEKIRVIHPPADTARFRPQPEAVAALRARYGFQEHETVFLFPSTGHKRKGLDLLAAFFEHTDLPVKLAVAGSPLPRPMKNVVELGFCTEMPDLYRAADFTVMASVYEPFGLVGVESVLCGTRVVLSDNMACTEVLNENAGFFFPRNRPEALADAVAQAVALKQSGRHKIDNPMQALNYDPTLDHHIELLLKLLDA